MSHSCNRSPVLNWYLLGDLRIELIFVTSRTMYSIWRWKMQAFNFPLFFWDRLMYLKKIYVMTGIQHNGNDIITNQLVMLSYQELKGLRACNSVALCFFSDMTKVILSNNWVIHNRPVGLEAASSQSWIGQLTHSSLSASLTEPDLFIHQHEITDYRQEYSLIRLAISNSSISLKSI